MKITLYEETTLTDRKLGDYVLPEKYILTNDINLVDQDILTTTFEVKIKDTNGAEFNTRTLVIDNYTLELIDPECEIICHFNIEDMDIGMEHFNYYVIEDRFPFDEEHSYESYQHFMEINDDESYDQDWFDYYYSGAQDVEDDVIYNVIAHITETFKETIQQYNESKEVA
ncbi:hypothetical protein VCRA2117O328_10234 [Vibrio crassostreae]|nr:hypothetical protein VCRA2117O328_10234 [Vibrio crassostreae]